MNDEDTRGYEPLERAVRLITGHPDGKPLRAGPAWPLYLAVLSERRRTRTALHRLRPGPGLGVFPAVPLATIRDWAVRSRQREGATLVHFGDLVEWAISRREDVDPALIEQARETGSLSATFEFTIHVHERLPEIDGELNRIKSDLRGSELCVGKRRELTERRDALIHERKQLRGQLRIGEIDGHLAEMTRCKDVLSTHHQSSKRGAGQAREELEQHVAIERQRKALEAERREIEARLRDEPPATPADEKAPASESPTPQALQRGAKSLTAPFMDAVLREFMARDGALPQFAEVWDAICRGDVAAMKEPRFNAQPDPDGRTDSSAKPTLKNERLAHKRAESAYYRRRKGFD